MTNEEVLKIVNFARKDYEKIFKKNNSMEEYYDVLTNALEKQIPKKLYYVADGYADGELVYDEASCPSCEFYFEDGVVPWGCNYCPNCGQRLDWSEDNEQP